MAKYVITVPAEGTLTYEVHAHSLEEAVTQVQNGTAEYVSHEINNSGESPDHWTGEVDGQEIDFSEFE